MADLTDKVLKLDMDERLVPNVSAMGLTSFDYTFVVPHGTVSISDVALFVNNEAETFTTHVVTVAVKITIMVTITRSASCKELVTFMVSLIVKMDFVRNHLQGITTVSMDSTVPADYFHFLINVAEVHVGGRVPAVRRTDNNEKQDDGVLNEDEVLGQRHAHVKADGGKLREKRDGVLDDGVQEAVQTQENEQNDYEVEADEMPEQDGVPHGQAENEPEVPQQQG